MFNVKNTACGHVRLTEAVSELVEGCGHLHVSGPSLFSAQIIEMTKSAIGVVKGNGQAPSLSTRISATRSCVTRKCVRPLAHAGVVRHLSAQRGRADPAHRRGHAGRGDHRDPRARGHRIVVKKGAEGATYYDATGR